MNKWLHLEIKRSKNDVLQGKQSTKSTKKRLNKGERKTLKKLTNEVKNGVEGDK